MAGVAGAVCFQGKAIPKSKNRVIRVLGKKAIPILTTPTPNKGDVREIKKKRSAGNRFGGGRRVN